MSAHFLLLAIILLNFQSACTQQEQIQFVEYSSFTVGAEKLLSSRLDMLTGKKVGIVANQSSLIGEQHLVDLLVDRDINLVKIFSPEHGFRGEAEAGAHIEDGFDQKTGIPVVSLYGNHRKPSKSDLEDIDIMLFDLQDVGARFYTYISTLTLVMEACAEQNIPVVVLDRPNPNGFYVDGPVLDTAYSSFVGMHPVPVVYGMTIGEYGLMVNGEQWLKGGIHCDLEVIKLEGYQHSMIFELPIKPSPNLPTWESVFLYPSLCFLEGTVMSIGRGTDYAFQCYGHPDFMVGSFLFTPVSRPGASLHPKFEGIACYGQNLSGYANALKDIKENPMLASLIRINLSWLLGSYELLKDKHDYFIGYFDTLAGSDVLREQIQNGMTESEIRKSWQKDLAKFMKVRETYLLYD